MAATATATRHPEQMPLLRPGCPTAALKKPRTEAPFPPDGPHTATIRHPGIPPGVWQAPQLLRWCCVAHDINAHGITRSQVPSKAKFSGEPAPPESRRNRYPPLARGRERETTHPRQYTRLNPVRPLFFRSACGMAIFRLAMIPVHLILAI
ncbi:hypothetical protein TcCL_ESM10638 [Trypanosoma cruzi]|nr:hypothetical protein TcCL_ESM10638 [Trypanosoma cruzi]